MTKPVAVLGCGPAGLMAAHACTLAGRPFAIFSNPTKSVLGGAQFLHHPIPGVTSVVPDAMITYRVYGSEEDYRHKVYGDEEVPFVSISKVADGQWQEAWNLRAAYDRLWEMYGDKVNRAIVNPEWIAEKMDEFDMVFSTVPLVSICCSRAGLISDVHRFMVHDIGIYPGQYIDTIEENTIVYDGTDEHSWYRASSLFGTHGTEWSGDSPNFLNGIIRDRKPTMTTCDCWEGKVVRLGRRGTWNKGVLTHDAFIGAERMFS